MRHTLFIADLHLDPAHSLALSLFERFMLEEAPLADALYILGDFFELWIGDDHLVDFQKHIDHCLQSLIKKGTPIYFIPGNRDFLIGKQFEASSGCKVLPEPSIIQLYGKHTILVHGDGLCSEDKKHMYFRKLTRNTLFKTLFLALPLPVRQYLGYRTRRNSKLHTKNLPLPRMDVSPDTVASLLRKLNVYQLIHGHTHQPQVHNFWIDNQMAERVVLGSWERQGCFLKWFESGKREMFFFS